jgi:hypothetical protein
VILMSHLDVGDRLFRHVALLRGTRDLACVMLRVRPMLSTRPDLTFPRNLCGS